MYWAAAKSMHHNLYGGLLYHIYRMGKNADMQCDLYPMINRDLLICGVYLHDIGKLMEFNPYCKKCRIYNGRKSFRTSLPWDEHD